MAWRGRSRERHANRRTSETLAKSDPAESTSALSPAPVEAPEVEHALGEQLAALLDPRGAGLRIAAQPTAVRRPDAASVFRIDDAAGRARAVVLCSPREAPDIVARGVERAREAKQAMLATEARHVLDPLAMGRLDGLSYAVMPYCAELSRGRMAWALQRSWVAPALFDWLWRVNAATVRPAHADERETHFAKALARLAMQTALSPPVRAAALGAAGRLRAGRWRVQTVLMHGDLWKANVLLRPTAGLPDAATLGRRFVVIDWPASNVRGHAIFDLVRLAQSMSLSPAALRREVGRHCAVLQCASKDAMSYLLAACGDLASDMQHFSMELFVPMVESCHATLDDALRNGPGER